MSHILVILNTKFLSAIFSTIFIILIGYFLRKKNKVTEQGSKILSSILLSAALPALAFNAFMQDIKPETYTTGINVLIFGFVAYVLLIFLSYIFYIRYEGDAKKTMIVLTTFGSTTFFGIPIINGLLGSTGTLYANIFNIAYRVFLYSFGLIMMSGIKFEKKNLKQIFLNPIILATFLGLIIWIFQKYIPFARIDKTAKPIFAGLKYLGNLSSPLAWLAIGMTLANISLKEALEEVQTLVYGVIKLIVIPLIFLVLLIILNSLGIHFQYEAITSIIIMLATPPATVAVAYAIKFDKKAVLASNISLVNTVLSVFAIIIWIVVLTITHGMGLI
ncbi:AEC family transporter [Sneathia vaginalis]|jgi:transporter, auxin efflux carrier family|uniref:AEC family transporter n=1 Tax=Sneathia vaginalis TaxID=187101 RepID=UPI00259A157D|nr:AEC family transporter [Sneathia vaginalis]